MDEKDLISQVWEQTSADMRQMDAQRNTLSNIILVLDVALIGVLARTDTAPYAIFMALLLLLLGVFGILTVAKYYERYKYYKNRAEALLKELSSLVEKGVQSILSEADVSHDALFQLRTSFKVYRVWYIVHCIALGSGLYFLYV